MSFDAYLEVRRGEDLTLAVEGGRVLRGISSGSWGAGVEKVHRYRGSKTTGRLSLV